MRRRLVTTVIAATAVAALAVPLSASPTQLRDDRPLDVIVDEWRERAGAPGVSVAVLVDGEPMQTVTSGLADEENRRPLAPGDRFHIGSVTKMVVATAALRLVEDGQLRLDDPLGRWLDRPERFSDVTVRQLLSHTSGIPDYAQGTDLFEDLEQTRGPEELLGLIDRAAPLFPAGEGFHYSNTNYVLAGLVIEAVTGRPYADVIEAEVARPLALRDLGVGIGATARGYADIDYDTVPDRADERVDLTALTHASGSAVSTAADLVTFTAELFDGLLLEPSTLASMLDASASGGTYGMGVQHVRIEGVEPVVGHGGGVPGYTAVAWWLPERRTAIAVLVNTSARADDLAELILRATN